MKHHNEKFSFVYMHPVTFANRECAVNITVDALAVFYRDGELRTVDVVGLQSMGSEIPITFVQMMMWEVWDDLSNAAMAHAKKKFNSQPVNS